MARSLALSLLAMAALSGCGTSLHWDRQGPSRPAPIYGNTAYPSPGPQAAAPQGSGPIRPSRAQYWGTVESVSLVQTQHQVGTGAVLGAIAGGILGSQVGTGSTLAALSGAMVGGVIGHRIEGARTDANAREVIVLLDNGERVALAAPLSSESRARDRVKLIQQADGYWALER